MKRLIPLILILFLCRFGIGQTVVFSDDFEAYNVGESLAAQSGEWETWSGGTTGSEAALVSDAQANSGTQSLNVVAGNDMIYDLGNKTSGVYQIDFYYFVASGSEGYFNIEHIFGSEWAFSCTFAGGTMTLAKGDGDVTTSYAEDTWLHFVIDIDIDGDEAVLNIDDAQVATWPFSITETTQSGTNQLGVINYYGPANNNFFVDDFQYIEIESGLDPPTIDIVTDQLTSEGESLNLDFDNIGEEQMNFRAYPVYDEPVNPFRTNRDGILHHDGDNANALGWGSSFDVSAAVRFLPQYVAPFAGQEITSVDVYINNAPTDDEITVFVAEKEGYITPGTGTLITEKTVTVTAESWNTIELDVNVPLDGEEVWVGYTFNHPGADQFCLGMDAEPLVDNSNYLKTGPVWSEFEGVGGDGMGNFNIRANVTGSSWPNWLDITPASGTVEGSGTEMLTLAIVDDDLLTGEYNATLVLGCNDPEQEWTEIPVSLDYVVGINENDTHRVMTYPNPCSGIFYIRADQDIDKVQVYDLTGRLIESRNVNASDTQISFAGSAGTYLVQIYLADEVLVKQVIVK